MASREALLGLVGLAVLLCGPPARNLRSIPVKINKFSEMAPVRSRVSRRRASQLLRKLRPASSLQDGQDFMSGFSGGDELEILKLQEVQSVAAISAAWKSHTDEMLEKTQGIQSTKEAELNATFPPEWDEWVHWAWRKDSESRQLSVLRSISQSSDASTEQGKRLLTQLRQLERSDTIGKLVQRAQKKLSKGRGPKTTKGSRAGEWMPGLWITSGGPNTKPHAIVIEQGLHSYEARMYGVDQLTRKFGKFQGGTHGGFGEYDEPHVIEEDLVRAMTSAPAVPYMGEIDIGPFDLSVLEESIGDDDFMLDDSALSDDYEQNFPDVSVQDENLGNNELPNGIELIGGSSPMDTSFLSGYEEVIDPNDILGGKEGDKVDRDRKDRQISNTGREENVEEAALQVVGISVNENSGQEIEGQVLWQVLVREERSRREVPGTDQTKWKRSLKQQSMGLSGALASLSAKYKGFPDMEPLVLVLSDGQLEVSGDGDVDMKMEIVGGKDMQSAIDNYLYKGVRLQQINWSVAAHLLPIEINLGPVSALLLFADEKGPFNSYRGPSQSSNAAGNWKLKGAIFASECRYSPAQMLRIDEDEIVVSVEPRWPLLSAVDVHKKLKEVLSMVPVEGRNANGMLESHPEKSSIFGFPSEESIDHEDSADSFDPDEFYTYEEDDDGIDANSPNGLASSRDALPEEEKEIILSALDYDNARLIAEFANLWAQDTGPLRYQRIPTESSDNSPLEGFFAGVVGEKHELLHMQRIVNSETGQQRLVGRKIAGDGPVEIGELLFESAPFTPSTRNPYGVRARSSLSLDEPPHNQIKTALRLSGSLRHSPDSWMPCELLVLEDDSPAKMNGCPLALYIPPATSMFGSGIKGRGGSSRSSGSPENSGTASAGFLVNMYEVEFPSPQEKWNPLGNRRER